MVSEITKAEGLPARGVLSLALLRDGFHAESPGGRVRLKGDGTPELDYPLNAFVMDGAILAGNIAKFKAPAGKYYFWCDIPGHEAAGMWGYITAK